MEVGRVPFAKICYAEFFRAGIFSACGFSLGAWLSLARAPGSGPGGRWFKSTRPDHLFSQRHTLFTQLQRVMALVSAQVLGKKNTIKRAISRTLSTSWSTKFIYSHEKKNEG